VRQRLIGTIGFTLFNGQEKALIRAAIGRILSQDAGKRVYQVTPTMYQVENDSQVVTRLVRSRSPRQYRHI